MGTTIWRRREWILVPGILCIVLMVSLLAFGQEQPPQQNQQPPGGPMNQRAARGPMAQGMPGSWAQGPGMQGTGMRRPNGPRMMHRGPEFGQRDAMAELLRPDVQKELAITAEQRKKLEDIRFNSEKESIQHRAAIQIQHMELSRLMEADNPDRAAIDKKLQELAQEESALLRSSINTRLNFRAVLTAEQRTKLAQFRQNRMGRGRPQAEGSMQPGRPAPAKQ